MKKPVFGFSTISRQKKNNIQFIVLMMLLVSLACTLPGLTTPSETGSSTPAPVPATLETPLQTIFPPALLEVWPADGSLLARQQEITLYFNQPMNRETVENALTFFPSLPGKIEWLNESTLKYIPTQPLPVDTEIKMTLAASAASQTQQAMLSESTFTFHSPPLPIVKERVPQANATGVDPSAPVVVSFDQPIVPLTAGVQTNEAPAFTLEPQAAGKGEWINTSTYVFYPTPPLKGNLSYKLILRSDLAEMDEFRGWNFTTLQADILSIDPDAGKTPLPLDANIHIHFNQPMEPKSVEQNVLLRSKIDDSSIKGTYTWNEDFTQVTYKPATLLARDSVYTLNLTSSVQAANGDGLSATRTFEYRTVSPLTLLSSNPQTNELIDFTGANNIIYLKFNTSLGQQSFTSLLKFDPPVGNLSAYLPEDNSLFISAIFKPDTAYHLTVSPNLADRWGGKLPGAIELDYKTSTTRPSLKVPMLQFTDTLFVRPQDVTMMAQATNINSLMMRSQPIEMKDFMSLSGDDKSFATYQLQSPDTWLLRFSGTSQGKQVPIQLSARGAPLKPGLYLYHLSSTDLVAAKSPDLTFLAVVSHVQLTLKRSLKEMLVWAVDLNNYQPLPQKALLLYNQNGTAVARCTTDTQGKCLFDIPSEGQNPNSSQYFVVLGQLGEPDFSLALDNWQMGISGYDFGINNQLEDTLPYVYLYTDRPIYRPGQTVYFRTVARQAENGRYQLAALSQLKLKVIKDSPDVSDSSPTLATIPITLSPYGTSSGSFKLPDDASIGYYHFEFEEQLKTDYVSFKVAAYRKPQVELKVESLLSDLKAGSNIQAKVAAQYYFGAPAARLPVSWSLYAQSDLYNLPDGYQGGKMLPFGGDEFLWGMMEGAGLGKLVTSGEEKTDPNGQLDINILAGDLNQLDLETLNKLTLEVTLDDGSSIPVSARTSMRLHPADVSIGVKQEGWGAQAGKEISFMIQTADWQSKPAGGVKMSASLQKVSWLSANVGQTETAYPSYPSPMYTQVASVDLTTDDYGQARIAFTPTEPGDYRLELRGQIALTHIWTWVGGVGSSSWADLPNQHLRLTADAAEYLAGQTARIFIPNPLQGGDALALITVERGKVMESQVVSISGADYEYDLPITDDLAPNVFISVTLLGRTPENIPDFRQGYQEIKVKPDAQTLKVAFIAQPEKSLPGGETLLAMRVEDSKGYPVKGQFSVSLVDKALLALSDPNSKSILDAFYSENPLGVLTSLSMAGYSNRLSFSVGPGGRGGGGGDEPVVRQNFADTAFWKADVETDEKGIAQLQVKLPDNLTTWVAQVRGLTTDTRVGEAKLEVVVSKPLMVEPVTPRFVVVDDHFQIGAVVHNNTPQPLTVEVTLNASGLALDNPDQVMQVVQVEAMGQSRVIWWVTAQDVPSADLVFSAKAGDLIDKTLLEGGSLPILRYETPQTFATMAVMPEAGSITQLIQLPRSFKPTGGELRVEFTPSLATGVLSELKAIESVPFESNETIVSSLLSSLAISQVLQTDNPTLQELKTHLETQIRHNVISLRINQNKDGGWGWVKEAPSSPHISAYILIGLGKAAQAGYVVDVKTLEGGQQYLQNQLMGASQLNQTSQYNQQVFIQYALLISGAPKELSGITLADWVASYQFVDQLSPWAQALLALGLQEVQPQNPQAAQITTNLMNKTIRMSTGVYWQEEQTDEKNFSSPNFNTAVVTYALSKLSVDPKTLSESANFLMQHRRARGGWNSTYENAWVLMALGEVMKINHDMEADYGYSATFNNQLMAVKQHGKDTNQNMLEEVVPVSQLKLDVPNILVINRSSGLGSLFYRIYLKVDQPVATVQPLQKGMSLTRHFELSGQDCPSYPCQMVDQVSLKQIKSPLKVRLTLVVPKDMVYVSVQDTIPAGMEVVNRMLNTTQQGTGAQPTFSPQDIINAGWNSWAFGEPKLGERTVSWVAEQLTAGTYQLTYLVIPEHIGKFNVLPAHAYQTYYPEVEASSAGMMLEIKE